MCSLLVTNLKFAQAQHVVASQRFSLGPDVCLAQFGTSRHRHLSATLRHYDVARTMRMAAFGGLLAGPLGHYWYNVLDRVCPSILLKAAASISYIALCIKGRRIICSISFVALLTLRSDPRSCGRLHQHARFPGQSDLASCRPECVQWIQY